MQIIVGIVFIVALLGALLCIILVVLDWYSK